MADVFNGIWGQPKVRNYLRCASSRGALSHAYLLCGPAGSGKVSASYALAASRLCKKGGCGSCEICKRVLRRRHPDVRYYEPEGAAAYLVGQVREIMSDVVLAPIQADAKVYIINRADLLNAASANAFLKTLEEPPAGVMLILLARTVDAVLPTIVSRCQVIPFRTVPEEEAIGLVSQNAGVPEERARMALAACDGSAERAVDFARSNKCMAHMRDVFEMMGTLRQCDDWDIITMSRKLVTFAEAPLDDVRREQEEYLEANADFLSRAAVKQIRERDERATKSATRQAQVTEMSLLKSWLRDVMVLCIGAEDLVVNTEALSALEDAASHTTEAAVASAIRAVDTAIETLSCNVSPQTCMDTLLFDIREALYD